MSLIPRNTRATINNVPLNPLLNLDPFSDTSLLTPGLRQASLNPMVHSDFFYNPLLMSLVFVRQDVFPIPISTQQVQTQVRSLAQIFGGPGRLIDIMAEHGIQRLIESLLGGLCWSIGQVARDPEPRARKWRIPETGGVRGSRSDFKLISGNGEILVTGEVKTPLSFNVREMEMLKEAVSLQLVEVGLDGVGTPEVRIRWAGMPAQYPSIGENGRFHQVKVCKILEQASPSVF